MADADGPVDPAELRARLGMSRSKLTAAINRLEDAGEVEVRADGAVARPSGAPPIGEAVGRAVAADIDRARFADSRIEMMRGYAEHDNCRRQFLLSYFGEDAPDFCGNCDVCDRRAAGLEPPARRTSRAAAGEFAPGAAVVHHEWGPGQVQRVDAGQLVVLFDHVGYKTLALDVVRERDLLKPA